MKLKSLLFGSAAVLAAGTGAQAADLPTVEPVEFVRICDVFGTGFFYIPGTDTCLKLSGYVRAESHYVTGSETSLGRRFGVHSNGLTFPIAGSTVDNWTSRVRGHVEWDARTQTDIGLIRAFIALEGTRGPGDGVTEAGATGPGGPGNDSYGTGFGLASAFIQISNDWGTYTAGKFGSFFDFWGDHSFGSTRIGIEPGTDDPNLFAWTFAGGNGFSFSVSAEDPKSIGRRRNGDDDYEGQEFPDGVANIRVDQGWGSAQVMGVVHSIHDVNGDGLGWAVGAGLGLNIPGGWRVDAQGGFSEGAISYISSDPGAIGDFNGPDGSDTNESWSVRAGITGPLFNPNLTVWADGSFVTAEEDDGGDEYDFFGVIAGAKYALAPGLVLGPEFAYNNHDGDDAGEDYDIWGVMWRIQRNF
jgi:hypothetical protein